MILEILVCFLALLMFANLIVFTTLLSRRPLRIKAGLVMLPASSVACFAMILQFFITDFAGKSALYTVSSLLHFVLFTSFLILVMEATHHYNPFKPKVFILFLIIPAMSAVAILTDPWFHLFNQSITLTSSQYMGELMVLANPSIIGLVWISYFNIIGTAFALVMFRYFYKMVTRQMALIFLGGVVLIHFIILASYFINDLNLVFPDNVGFAVAGFFIYWYSFRYGLFDIAPASREKMVNLIQDSIVAVDNKGLVTDLNEPCTKLIGQEAKDVIGKTFSQTFASLPGFDVQFEPNSPVRLPAEVTDLTGRSFEVTVKEFNYGRPLKVGSMIILHDLTERKILEEAMRKAEAQEKIAESERKYRTVVDNQTEAIISFRPDGTVTFANKVLEKYLEQWGIHDYGLLNVKDILSDEDYHRLKEAMIIISPSDPIRELEIIIDPEKGRPLNILFRVKGLFSSTGILQEVQAVGMDITERRQLMVEQAKNQKLESLGVLAGGIAHDFNNMLTAIVSNIEIAKLDHPEDEKHNYRLEESVRSAMRARLLTQKLLTFSKGGKPIKELVDLTALMQSSVEFVLAGSTVVANFDIDDDLRTISADSSQIEQVLNNLIINAMQAMPQGGHIMIKASNLARNESLLYHLDDDQYVRIEITDEGCGIPEDILDKIFDPFFTTKQTGTGLGLSTVQSIVRNHGGIVLVDSKVGKGTKFSIILPAEEQTISSPSIIKPKLEVRRTGNILVMDDEEPILDVLSMLLQSLGYESTCVKCGEEAISAYQDALSCGHPYNAVIMDLTIRGGMGGKEAVQKILSVDPKALVIVSSGYSNDPIMAHPKEYGFCNYLQKPFTIEEISDKLSEVLVDASCAGP